MFKNKDKLLKKGHSGTSFVGNWSMEKRLLGNKWPFQMTKINSWKCKTDETGSYLGYHQMCHKQETQTKKAKSRTYHSAYCHKCAGICYTYPCAPHSLLLHSPQFARSTFPGRWKGPNLGLGPVRTASAPPCRAAARNPSPALRPSAHWPQAADERIEPTAVGRDQHKNNRSQAQRVAPLTHRHGTTDHGAIICWPMCGCRQQDRKSGWRGIGDVTVLPSNGNRNSVAGVCNCGTVSQRGFEGTDSRLPGATCK